jgi:hypothetical protein
MKNYPYYGLNLSKRLAEDFLNKYWNKIDFLKQQNKVVTFSDLNFHVKEFHEKHGGVVTTSKLASIIKKYSAKNPQKIKPTQGKGKWVINPIGSKYNSKNNFKESSSIMPKKLNPDIILMPTDVYGKGRYYIYVFYNKNNTLCKIGKTINSVKTRYNQLKTGMAENYTHPILVRLNKESDMKNYEKVIEYLLKYQGCHHKGEFYKIKIDELKKIIIGVNSMLKIKETKY